MLTNYGGFAAAPPHAFVIAGGMREHQVNERIRLWVRADGLVVFDFTRWRPGRRPSPKRPAGTPTEVFLRRSELMNCYSFALAAVGERTGIGLGRVPYVSPDDQLHFIEPGGQPLGRFVPASQARHSVAELALDEVLSFFSGLVINDLLIEGDLMARAVSHELSHAHGPGLSAVWPVAERLVYRRWVAYLDENRRRPHLGGKVIDVAGPGLTAEQLELERVSFAFIDDARMQALSRWDAARVIEALSLLDLIDHDTYQALTRARRARNDWVHGLKRVDSLDMEAAFDGVAALMRALYGISFEIRVGGSVSGFTLTDEEAELERSVAQERQWPPPTTEQ